MLFLEKNRLGFESENEWRVVRCGNRKEGSEKASCGGNVCSAEVWWHKPHVALDTKVLERCTTYQGTPR